MPLGFAPWRRCCTTARAEGFAASCAEKATTVRIALGARGNVGPAFQATSAAVTISDSTVDAACQSLATRIDDLSSKLSSAAAAY